MPHLQHTHRRFTAIIEWSDGFYMARCPELGTVAAGATEEEALDQLVEVSETYLRAYPALRRRNAVRGVAMFDLPEEIEAVPPCV